MTADSLSRNLETEEASTLVVTAVEMDWLDQLRSMVTTEEFFKDLNAKWEAGTLNPGEYQKRGNLFYYKNRILLSPSTQLLISEHHDTPVGGHSGYEKNTTKVQEIGLLEGNEVQYQAVYQTM